MTSSSRDNQQIWRALVDNSPGRDVYFRPEYLRLSEIVGGGNALALVCGYGALRALCPLLVRRESKEAIVSDAFTPYGYGGLLWLSRPFVSPESTSYIFACIRKWCISEKLVCCFLRMHPLLADSFCLSEINDPDYIIRERGLTNAVDLANWDSVHQRISSLKAGRISDLSRARRSLSVIIAEGPEDIRKYLPVFRSLYEENMRRLHATPFYYFPDAYYAELLESMTPYLMLSLAQSGEQVIGASMFFYDKNFAHYHLSGATSEGLRLKAPTLLVNEAAGWARAKGCKQLHLGGGIGLNDGLHLFKASFGGAQYPYTYVTVIADHDKYNRLMDTQPLIWPYGQISEPPIVQPSH